MPITVLIADEQPLLRRGLLVRLGAESDLEVVGEAGDGTGALALARSLRPDVAVLDVALPRLDGLAATRAIRAAGLPTRVLIFTSDEHQLGAALAAGATGFLGKDHPTADAVVAIRAVAAGLVVTPRLPPPVVPPALAELTEREREVLAWVARGLSNGEIAARLGVGETTVKTHVGRVLTKLDLRDRVRAVVFAYETGLVLPAGNRPPEGRTIGHQLAGSQPSGNSLAPGPTVSGDMKPINHEADQGLKPIKGVHG